MVTSITVRSLRSWLLAGLVISALATACKKTDADSGIDPRDQYVGTYEGGEKGFSSALNVGGFEGAVQYGSATITITKGANVRELYIDTQSSLGRPTPLKVTAELDGSTFTVIDRNRDQMNVLGVVVEGDFKATGVFDKNQVVITTSTEGLRTGATAKRIETINGTKK